jgi:hypothetical protein
MLGQAVGHFIWHEAFKHCLHFYGDCGFFPFGGAGCPETGSQPTGSATQSGLWADFFWLSRIAEVSAESG